MADQADVETALAALAANALYPEGILAASAIGNVCRVYRGFPSAPALDADIAAHAVNVTVAAAGEAKNVTRYPRRWVTVAPVAAVLNVTLSANAAAFSGQCAVGQLAGVLVNGTAYSYAVQANDSPATVASNMAAMLRGAGWVVDYAGSTIGLPQAVHFTARVVAGAGALLELKRQQQDFKISLWCPDPTSRDAASALLDAALAAENFIPLADGAYGRLMFADSVAQDAGADAAVYRRDLTYSVEYPTTQAQVTPAMLFGGAGVTVDGTVQLNLEA